MFFELQKRLLNIQNSNLLSDFVAHLRHRPLYLDQRGACCHRAGDGPWIRCLVDVSIAPQVGSIYNKAIWDSATQQYQGSQQRRTPQCDADHNRQYLLHGHSLEHAGCVANPLLRMAREHTFMCIMHCIMAMDRCSDPDRVLRAGVQSILDVARTGICLGSAASLDGEAVYRLLQSWEQVQHAAQA